MGPRGLIRVGKTKQQVRSGRITLILIVGSGFAGATVARGLADAAAGRALCRGAAYRKTIKEIFDLSLNDPEAVLAFARTQAEERKRGVGPRPWDTDTSVKRISVRYDDDDL